MKWVFERATLVKALQRVVPVINPRVTKDILKNALFEKINDTMVEIIATDMEIGIRIHCPAVKLEGVSKAVMPAGTLLQLLKDEVDDHVTVALPPNNNAEDQRFLVTTAGLRTEIYGYSPDQFVEVPAGDIDPIFKVNAAQFIDWLDHVKFAAAKEVQRYAIFGVYMNVSSKDFEIVATDGHRLARRKTKFKSAAKENTTAILPLPLVDKIKALLGVRPEMPDAAAEGEATEASAAQVDGKLELALAVDSRCVYMKVGDAFMWGHLVEGTYPQYEAVIPKNNHRFATLDRHELIRSLRQAIVMTSVETRLVQFDFTKSKDHAVITGRSDAKGEAEITIPCKYDGDADMKIAFNPQYLLEPLTVIAGNEVKLEMDEQMKPVLLQEGKDYLYVIMPAKPFK
ncbi:MAG TPA: DNA polymerase III subunit beta [Planctomycetota bacterium]|nr:DNA polymerase III subunit beta [Planctomycetota bacterium]